MTKVFDEALLVAHNRAVCELLEIAERLPVLMDGQLESLVDPSPRGTRKDALYEMLESIADPAARAARMDALLERQEDSLDPATRAARAAQIEDAWIALKYELGAAAARLVEAEAALHGAIKTRLYVAPDRKQ